MGLPEVFRDSQPGMLLKIWIDNGYEKARFGPPIIPIFGTVTGYGFSNNNRTKKDSTQLRKVSLHLEIAHYGPDSLTFDPFAFYIISRRTGIKSFPIAVDSFFSLSGPIRCNGKCSWQIDFSPGVQVQDMPEVHLPTLNHGNRALYPDGIPFKIGKKSFYAAIIPVNG
jgi:hypothetical protein